MRATLAVAAAALVASQAQAGNQYIMQSFYASTDSSCASGAKSMNYLNLDPTGKCNSAGPHASSKLFNCTTVLGYATPDCSGDVVETDSFPAACYSQGGHPAEYSCATSIASPFASITQFEDAACTMATGSVIVPESACAGLPLEKGIHSGVIFGVLTPSSDGKNVTFAIHLAPDCGDS